MADKIVVGAGAGLSASAGLDYQSEAFFSNLYQPFLKKGHHTIAEAIGRNWFLSEGNALAYWGFWANHIHNVYYQQGLLDTYERLEAFLKEKDSFIITTNADGQFFKGSYKPECVFAMQGSYGKFQCQHRCHEKVYDNTEWIQAMLKSFNEATLKIDEEDIPRCPVCGGLMAPNLRVDQYFVEEPHMHNRNEYIEFVSDPKARIVFLELGVGYNTPGIIRFPFEEMTRAYDNATLIRVNRLAPETPEAIVSKAIATSMDIHELLGQLLN